MTTGIVIFGGNGFIGFEVVLALTEQFPNYKLFLINRGKSWEWNKKERLKMYSNISIVKCNRDNSLQNCKELAEILLNIDKVFAVVDLSGYVKFHVKDSVKYFASKAERYIYISTDSVYEVCPKTHSNPSTERDSVRPDSEEDVKKLKRHDSYGHKKLSCEETLMKYRGTMDCIILRLADVIGPRDSTERWWFLQLWVQLAKRLSIPIYLPDEVKNKTISLVYVKDVANMICKIISFDTVKFSSVKNQSYNLAFDEVCTVCDLVRQIAENFITIDEHGSEIAIEYSNMPVVPHLYPSVEKGPIDISKAVNELNWKTTLLHTAVKQTVNFYRNVNDEGKLYLEEKNDIYGSIIKDLKKVYKPSKIDDINTELKNILHL